MSASLEFAEVRCCSRMATRSSNGLHKLLTCLPARQQQMSDVRKQWERDDKWRHGATWGMLSGTLPVRTWSGPWAASQRGEGYHFACTIQDLSFSTEPSTAPGIGRHPTASL